MNTWEYMRARRYVGNVGRLKFSDSNGRMEPFYRRYGITHFANARAVDGTPPDNLLFEGLKFTTPSGARQFKLWAKAPADARAGGGTQAWESLAPLFDVRMEQVSFIIGDRLVQVFAQDCNSALLPKEFVVSWQDARGRRRYADYLWNKPAENSLGYCTEAFELPNDVVHSIRIEALGSRDFNDRSIERAQRIISDEFDVYLDGRRLLYVRENCQRERENTEAWFFLHVVPVDRYDMPMHRWRYGFDNLDFRFADRVYIDSNHCIATRLLPDYAIAAIRTGQYLRKDGHDPGIKRFSIRHASDNVYRFGGDTYVGRRLLATFEQGFDGWAVAGYITNANRHTQYRDWASFTGHVGLGFLSSLHPTEHDRTTGRAVSPEFTAQPDDHLALLLAGGRGTGGPAGVRLLADGQPAAVFHGKDTHRFTAVLHPLAEVAGKRLKLELFDDGGEGRVMLDHVLLMRKGAGPSGPSSDTYRLWGGRFDFAEPADDG